LDVATTPSHNENVNGIDCAGGLHHVTATNTAAAALTRMTTRSSQRATAAADPVIHEVASNSVKYCTRRTPSKTGEGRLQPLLDAIPAGQPLSLPDNNATEAASHRRSLRASRTSIVTSPDCKSVNAEVDTISDGCVTLRSRRQMTKLSTPRRRILTRATGGYRNVDTCLSEMTVGDDIDLQDGETCIENDINGSDGNV
jgi:hypothetical protein